MEILEKKQVVSTLIQQAGLAGQKARVILAVDHSASIEDLDLDGTMQEVVESAGAIALELDDNGELEVIVFEDKATLLPVPLTKDNYVGYVDKYIRDLEYGGTAYSPVVRMAIEMTKANTPKQVVYMKKSKKGGIFGFGAKDTSVEARETVYLHDSGRTAIPTLLILITDGDVDRADKLATIQQVVAASVRPIFIAALGVNGTPKPDFAFLKEVDTLTGNFLDCVSFEEVDAKKLKGMDVKKFMNSILGEFLTKYIPAAKKQHLIK